MADKSATKNTQVTVDLRRPITDHEGKELKKLTLQEPTWEDFDELGYPYGTRNEITVVIPSVCNAYLMRIAGQMPETIKKIRPADLSPLHSAVCNFLS